MNHNILNVNVSSEDNPENYKLLSSQKDELKHLRATENNRFHIQNPLYEVELPTSKFSDIETIGICQLEAVLSESLSPKEIHQHCFLLAIQNGLITNLSSPTLFLSEYKDLLEEIITSREDDNLFYLQYKRDLSKNIFNATDAERDLRYRALEYKFDIEDCSKKNDNPLVQPLFSIFSNDNADVISAVENAFFFRVKLIKINDLTPVGAVLESNC